LRFPPAATEGLNKLYAGGDLLISEVDSSFFGTQQQGLRSNYVQVRIDPQLVAVRRNLQISLRRSHRRILLLNLER